MSKPPEPVDGENARQMTLQKTVEPAGLDEFEIRELDAWLASKRIDYQLDQTLLRKFDSTSNRGTIEDCEKLLSTTSKLAKFLEDLVLRPTLENQLFLAAVALETPKAAAVRSQEWGAYKARLSSDVEDLQRVTRCALETVSKGRYGGRPKQHWRDTIFYELFQRLHAAGDKRSRGASIELALDVWQIYSPDASTAIMGDDAATMIVKRRGRGRAST